MSAKGLYDCPKVDLAVFADTGDEPQWVYDYLHNHLVPFGEEHGIPVRVTSAGRYFVRAHRARSRRFVIEVITIPRIERVRFRVTPPAYVNRPAMEGPLPHGGLSGLSGTFRNDLGSLCSKGWITYPQRGSVRASPSIFIDGDTA